MSFKTCLGFCVLALFASTGIGVAQTLTFSRDTDTVSISGRTVQSTDCTFEARVRPTSLTQTGNIWWETQGAACDKRLNIAPTAVIGYAWPASPSVFTAYGAFAVGAWHHVAYVKQGATESLYLDGNLIGTRACGMNIGNGSNPFMWLGYDGEIGPSFIGDVDTLRISHVARYSGASFAPPTGDLTSDSNTDLLYNFDEPIGSTTITDLSGNGHTGTLGVNRLGGTSPVFAGTSVYPTDYSLFRGYWLQGGLSDLREQDGRYLFVLQGNTAAPSEAPVQLMVDGAWSGPTAPSSLQVLVNSAASTPGLIQIINLYNFTTSAWETVSAHVLGLNDSLTSVTVSGNVGRFFDQSGNIKMRVQVRQLTPVVYSPWMVRFDEARWQATP